MRHADDRKMMLNSRRSFVFSAALWPALSPAVADPFEGDPHQSRAWPELKREFLGANAKVVFDARVEVQGPAFAEDSMNVPITVRVKGLPEVQRVLVLVDRNPIRKVLEFHPLATLPVIGFRFKLEQGSPVRAAVLTGGGQWHVGGTWVDSTGGGCTVNGATRQDGSWVRTLGQGQAKVYGRSAALGDAAARLRLRVMHPMDTGLVSGVPAFYLHKLALRDADGRELARLLTYEPVSENPVFSFDFAQPPRAPVSIAGSDNNGNRIALTASPAAAP
jgi:sulfur-oxidizing protein SoxY